MPVFRGSRYEGQDVTQVQDSTGVGKSFIHLRRPITLDDIGDQFSVHTVQPGEHLDELARKFSGDVTKWWVIADINGLFCALDLKAGADLVIPSRRFFAEL